MWGAGPMQFRTGLKAPARLPSNCAVKTGQAPTLKLLVTLVVVMAKVRLRRLLPCWLQTQPGTARVPEGQTSTARTETVPQELDGPSTQYPFQTHLGLERTKYPTVK